jgi:hypothetical protein
MYARACVGIVCVRWSNMVVVVDCDINFIATFFYQFLCYLTREKKNAYAIILIDT